jgi:diguanylate cyclase (GGDEF)-like protein
MGSLVQRHLADAALIAARQEAERDAADARQAAIALREEMASRKRAQSHLAYLASHDPLTTLPNRTFFNERLAAEMQDAGRAGRRIAVVYVDLDNFKDVNDTLGHASGDMLLRQFSKRIAGLLLQAGIVARLGGDEFAILLPNVKDATDAGKCCDRLVEALSEPFCVNERPTFIGISMGITIYPDDACTVELLHRNADLAMYRAKSDGRNRSRFYDEALNQEVQRRAALEQALREPSLLSQLRIVYQPQFALRAGRMSGVEALLRWEHPLLGAIQPAEFIRVAERAGLILDIGTWVLRESCRQAASWRAAGLPPLTMCVNVSTLQFREGNMPRLVAGILAETGLPGEALELEITETGVMQDTHVADEMLVALHMQGVGLAIDDFGTGYSSLSYLRRVPVDRLKIDRSFIHDVTTSEDAAIVASTIVQLAHSLRLQVVAEGVETRAQADFVRQTGAAFAQGFYYAPPVDADGIPALLEVHAMAARP